MTDQTLADLNTDSDEGDNDSASGMGRMLSTITASLPLIPVTSTMVYSIVQPAPILAALTSLVGSGYAPTLLLFFQITGGLFLLPAVALAVIGGWAFLSAAVNQSKTAAITGAFIFTLYAIPIAAAYYFLPMLPLVVGAVIASQAILVSAVLLFVTLAGMWAVFTV